MEPAGRSLRVPADAGLSLSARFRDNGELRYSLRSIERFAPFFRRVFLVVDGAPPPWLKPNVPDLRVVDHREIFPDDYLLPVFSSDQIEAYLWRIRDLSERYVYFNDDILLVQQCTEGDFFDPRARQWFA